MARSLERDTTSPLIGLPGRLEVRWTDECIHVVKLSGKAASPTHCWC